MNSIPEDAERFITGSNWINMLLYLGSLWNRKPPTLLTHGFYYSGFHSSHGEELDFLYHKPLLQKWQKEEENKIVFNQSIT